ncbi:M23 family metallopeptidase [Roseovarius indicus]|uniref:Peptidase M23 n=1 Tax=Roseovarius indicus TaxID=540747 RepID=A0A0T5P6N7_9RHOB|nr:M23 family metallopeptidase [Roseovarius indicus]KRS16591.1 peptidase M23 [Roseovarius indicus]QEW28380.1 putative peptidase [Roseovarius indicus]SFE11743.1 Peptidase family M23 [Roseovarius indicus]
MSPSHVAALLGAALWAAPSFAGPPQLSLPIDCTLGQTCVIEDYPDNDPGPGQRDYTCGLKTRDGHRGTDILLPSFDDMQRGVSVLAAAPGRVAAKRDGMADVPVTNATRETIRGRECGNAVRIDHGDGWQTLYCHMKKGSLRVRKGQAVSAGDPLGLVGLSGLTNVPHVHLTVLKDGNVVDPFLPDATAKCGTAPGKGLWASAPAYTPTGLFTAAFSNGVPEFEDVQSGAARVTQTTPDQPLVLYGHAFHAEPGDTLTLTASGPEGEIFTETIPLDDPQKQLFRAFGRRSPDGGWPPGAYRGYVTLKRGDTLIAVRHADITVSP